MVEHKAIKCLLLTLETLKDMSSIIVMYVEIQREAFIILKNHALYAYVELAMDGDKEQQRTVVKLRIAKSHSLANQVKKESKKRKRRREREAQAPALAPALQAQAVQIECRNKTLL